MTMSHVHRSPRSLRRLRGEIAPTHQVVGGRSEAKQPIDERSAAVAQLPQERDGLQPAKRLLHEFPFAMTQTVARVSCRARIDRAAAVAEFVLRDMRRDVH